MVLLRTKNGSFIAPKTFFETVFSITVQFVSTLNIKSYGLLLLTRFSHLSELFLHSIAPNSFASAEQRFGLNLTACIVSVSLTHAVISEPDKQ